MSEWTITLEEDPETGDLVLPLSDEILTSAGWNIGDTLNWVDNKDGSWSIQKVESEFDQKDDAVLALMQKCSDLEYENHNLKQEIAELKWRLEEHD